MQIMYGLKFLKYYLKIRKFLKKNKDSVYILSDKGIGDIFPTLAFLPAYRRKNGINRIVVLGISSKSELYQMYSNVFDELILFSDEEFTTICKFSSSDLFNSLVRKYGRLVSTRVGSNSRQNYVLRLPNICYIDTIRYGVFDLSTVDDMLSPNVPTIDITRLIGKYELKKDKTIIVNPYANSITGIEKSFFEKLVLALKANGMLVVTSLSSEKQLPIAGTIGIKTSLSEAYYLAKYCGCVIGLRSGFLDFISYAKCKVLALYPKEYQMIDFQLLSKWGVSDSAFDLRLSDDVTTDINYICSFLSGK